MMDLITNLLKEKYKLLTWVEQVPSIDSTGAEIGADIINIASVKDCIDMQRKYCYIMGERGYNKVKNYKEFTEEELLSEFMLVNCARVYYR